MLNNNSFIKILPLFIFTLLPGMQPFYFIDAPQKGDIPFTEFVPSGQEEVEDTFPLVEITDTDPTLFPPRPRALTFSSTTLDAGTRTEEPLPAIHTGKPLRWVAKEISNQLGPTKVAEYFQRTYQKRTPPKRKPSIKKPRVPTQHKAWVPKDIRQEDTNAVLKSYFGKLTKITNKPVKTQSDE